MKDLTKYLLKLNELDDLLSSVRNLNEVLSMAAIAIGDDFQRKAIIEISNIAEDKFVLADHRLNEVLEELRELKQQREKRGLNT